MSLIFLLIILIGVGIALAKIPMPVAIWWTILIVTVLVALFWVLRYLPIGDPSWPRG